MERTNIPLRITAVLFLAGACTETPMDPIDADGIRAEAASVSMTHAQADFPFWVQGFQVGTEGWITASTPGPGGWCGEIHARDGREGDRRPSAGKGYAIVTDGPCNEYWSEHGFPEGSGPYSPGAGYSSAFPQGGFVTQLDIFLDPNWTVPNPFTYSVSIALLDQPYPGNFRYFLVPVVSSDGSLFVGEWKVTEAGWYTFRHVFTEEEGHLGVRFELDGPGRTRFAMAVESTTFSGERVSSFDATQVGTGYLWFVSIAPHLEVAIDEHQVRRGT